MQANSKNVNPGTYIQMASEKPNALAETDEITILDLVIAVIERKYMIVCVTAVAAILSGLVSLCLPFRYIAMTTLLPPQQPQSLTSVLASQLSSAGMLGAVTGNSLGLKNPNDLYVAMLRSRVVGDALVQKLNLTVAFHTQSMSDARAVLLAESTIQPTKEGMISIAVEDRDGARAAAIANDYVEELKVLTGKLAVTEASRRRLFFEQQLQRATSDLENAEAALKITQQKTGIIQLDSQAKGVIESVAIARAQIAAKEVQLRAVQSFASEQNPDVLMLRQELAGMQEQLYKLEKQSGDVGGDLVMPTRQIPDMALEYIRRVRDVKYFESIFELLAKQYEAAKLDEAREGVVIQVVDPAVAPEKRSSPKRGLIVMLSTFAGLIAAILCAFFAKSLEHIRKNPVTAEQLIRLKELLRFRRVVKESSDS